MGCRVQIKVYDETGKKIDMINISPDETLNKEEVALIASSHTKELVAKFADATMIKNGITRMRARPGDDVPKDDSSIGINQSSC